MSRALLTVRGALSSLSQRYAHLQSQAKVTLLGQGHERIIQHLHAQATVRLLSQGRGCSTQRTLTSALSSYCQGHRDRLAVGVLDPVTRKWEVKQRQGYATDVNIRAKVRGIQKDVSPLTTKRIVRRKKTRDSPMLDKEIFDAVAYATAEEINLESLKVDMEMQGLYVDIPLPKDVTDALHLEAKYRVDDETREIIFFREGSVVFWNMPEVERNAVLKFLRRHQSGSYDMRLIYQEYEQVEFTFTETPTQLVGDEIQLKKPDKTEDKSYHQLEKYAFSNALALSVKLSVWEASLERYVESIEWILHDLKEGKKVKVSRDEMLQKTGELYTLRHLINLSSDLLDTPDFYWDRENFEPLYTKTCNHLSIYRRTKVMNEKLTHCCELADLLISHLNDKHHTRLEWMIIILIMVEVCFEILHLIERYTVDDGPKPHSEDS